MLYDIIDRGRLDIVSPRRKLTERMLSRLAAFEAQSSGAFLADEQLWTMLFSYGFVAPGIDPEEGLAELAGVLTGGARREAPRHAWLEMLTMPPRVGEGNSHIDLALGDLALRQGQTGGIRYETHRGWIAFVEAKWLSDIAGGQTNDPKRNQLVRVIETALTFQDMSSNRHMPDEVHVALLTPACFQEDPSDPPSRHYGYLYRSYATDLEALLGAIRRCRLAKRHQCGLWEYPCLCERVRRVHLHWTTYEALFARMPASAYKEALRSFIDGRTDLVCC